MGILGLGPTPPVGFKVKTLSTTNSPWKLEVPKKLVRQVVLGQYHSVLITKDWDLYTFGNGTYGKLGHGIGNGKKWGSVPLHTI